MAEKFITNHIINIKESNNTISMIEMRNILVLDEDIKKSLRLWRNDPQIKQYMYNDHTITEEEHAQYLKNLQNTIRTQLFVVFYKNEPVGVIQFNDINENDKKCEYGMYSVPSSQFNGAYLEYSALSCAFEKLQIEKLNCTVLATNPHTVSLHKKFGLFQEGIIRKNIVRDDMRIDVICLGILKNEWEAKKQQLIKILKIVEEK